MEFQSVKIFYVHIDKIVKGKSTSRFVRIAYGYNPTSAPQCILPEEIFNGRTHSKFKLVESGDFNAKASISKEPNDWFDNKDSKIVKSRDFLSKSDITIGNDELYLTSITPKCVVVVCYENESSDLEKLETVKGYWLDFEKKNFKKLKN